MAGEDPFSPVISTNFRYEPSHGLAYAVVVSTHVGGIFVAMGPAVEEDDRNAAIVGPVDGFGEGARRIGSHNEEVHLFVYEVLYLLYLTLVVIVCRLKLQADIVEDVAAYLQFTVLLVPPDVLAAL